MDAHAWWYSNTLMKCNQIASWLLWIGISNTFNFHSYQIKIVYFHFNSPSFLFHKPMTWKRLLSLSAEHLSWYPQVHPCSFISIFLLFFSSMFVWVFLFCNVFYGSSKVPSLIEKWLVDSLKCGLCNSIFFVSLQIQ